MNCKMCSVIENILSNNFFVKEMNTGYVVLGKHQFYPGYVLFICKKHATELHELDERFRKNFLSEMSKVAEALHKAFKPSKINYELLGNSEPHLHWHIFPRYEGDANPKRPVWETDEKIRKGESTIPSGRELEKLKNAIRMNIL